ncbi:hypothetical protein Lesp01_02410 [Lentzea sp. NBRC 102530]|nr:hypothetical protein Lesp01_02410 [Lentzea sp. NBRC 102530]
MQHVGEALARKRLDADGGLQQAEHPPTSKRCNTRHIGQIRNFGGAFGGEARMEAYRWFNVLDGSHCSRSWHWFYHWP